MKRGRSKGGEIAQTYFHIREADEERRRLLQKRISAENGPDIEEEKGRTSQKDSPKGRPIFFEQA